MKKTLLSLTLFFTAALGLSAQGSVTGSYAGELYISLGAPIGPDVAGMPGQSVDLSAGAQGATVNFALYNFSLGEMKLGDIVLPSIGISSTADGYSFADNEKVSLSFSGGAILADAELNETTSWLKGDSLVADIDVMWTNAPEPMPIYVRFVGKRQPHQPADGSFNAEWTGGSPWDAKNGYFDLGTLSSEIWGYAAPYTRDMFRNPEGWCTSGVIGISGLGLTAVANRIAVAEGDTALVLTNNPNSLMKSQTVPGYVTLGTSWATALAGILEVKDADGGSFGGAEFTRLPDALRLRYKRTRASAESTQPASVVAYLWKGTYTQAGVPGNTAMSAKDIVKTDMVDRDRNILGMSTTVGGEVTATEDAALVAKINHLIEGEAADWTELEIPFEYEAAFDGKGIRPEKINIVLAAGNYFGDRAALVQGDSLIVDDVELVYYHALSALSYEGAALDFSEAVTSYDLSGIAFDASKLAYAKKGQDARVVENYDSKSGLLTLSVYGANSAERADAVTVYQLQFKGTVDGISTPVQTPAASGTYTLDGRRVDSHRLPKGVYIVNGRKVIVTR